MSGGDKIRFSGFNRKPVIKLRHTSHGRWECASVFGVGLADTPQEAYERWRNAMASFQKQIEEYWREAGK